METKSVRITLSVVCVQAREGISDHGSFLGDDVEQFRRGAGVLVVGGVGVDGLEVVDGDFDGFGAFGGFAGGLGALFDFDVEGFDVGGRGLGLFLLFALGFEGRDFLGDLVGFLLVGGGGFGGFLLPVDEVDGPAPVAVALFGEEFEEFLEAFEGEWGAPADLDVGEVVIPDPGGGLAFVEKEEVGLHAGAGTGEGAAGEGDDAVEVALFEQLALGFDKSVLGGAEEDAFVEDDATAAVGGEGVDDVLQEENLGGLGPKAKLDWASMPSLPPKGGFERMTSYWPGACWKSPS